jgi:hypothetical protein
MLGDRKKFASLRIEEEMAGKFIKKKHAANFESAAITSGKIKGSNKMHPIEEWDSPPRSWHIS